nr:hypothetical protein [Mycoplasmopsis bovis]
MKKLFVEKGVIGRLLMVFFKGRSNMSSINLGLFALNENYIFFGF